MSGKLLLLPNLLFETLDHHLFLPKGVDEAVFSIDGIIAEGEKNARAYLKRFAFSKGRTFREIPIKLLNEHTEIGSEEFKELLKPLIRGETWGLISDAGLPCLADPGSQLVTAARKEGILIEAFSGPCSLTLALMLSGLPAQAFSFHGYLPQEAELFIHKIKQLEEISKKCHSTQLFIETPYRTDKALENLLNSLKEATTLCVALDLTAPSQEVVVGSVGLWQKKLKKSFRKRPAVFLFCA
jgi:16S rRNA (cytidine1402-2'-O)-methyltransferase